MQEEHPTQAPWDDDNESEPQIDPAERNWSQGNPDPDVLNRTISGRLNEEDFHPEFEVKTEKLTEEEALGLQGQKKKVSEYQVLAYETKLEGILNKYKRFNGIIFLGLSSSIAFICLIAFGEVYLRSQSYPSFLKYTVWAFGCVLMCLALCGLIKIIKVFFSLNACTRYSITDIDSNVLNINAKERGKIKSALVNYLKEFPSTIKVDMSADEELLWGEIQKSKARLVNSSNKSLSSIKDEFKSCFQDKIEKIARKRIHFYASRCGLKTAVSPFSFFDIVIVIYYNTKLLTEIMLLFNSKPTRGALTIITLRNLIRVYLSSEMQESIAEFTEDVATDVVSGIGQKLLSSIASKGAEGIAQYLLLRRLGNHYINYLKPLHS